MIKRYFTGRKKIVTSLLLLGFLGAIPASAQESGKELFQQKCAACHSVGAGRLVGPDLAGVNERRSEAWLLNFIKSPQAVINSGDANAKALFDEYKMMMPDQPLSETEIKKILLYVKEASGGAAAPKLSTVPAAATATQAEINLGQDLFQGKVRFAKAGPSCISCHSAHYGNAISGGILAKELTTVYSRLGAPGIRAILSNPPFPVMQTAYAAGAISESEINALIGFLQQVDKQNVLHQPREYGWAMFLVGVAGVLVLLGIYSVLGRRRKKGSVNQKIYDRQIKSE